MSAAKVPYEVINRLRRQVLIGRQHDKSLRLAKTEEELTAVRLAQRTQVMIIEQIKGELAGYGMSKEKIADVFKHENSRTTTELEWLTKEQ